MDRASVDVYEGRAAEWQARRRPAPRGGDRAGARALARRAAGLGAGPVADLGCGPGWLAPSLGPGPVVAVDAAAAMVGRVRDEAPGAWPVRADLAALPVRRGALGGAWACRSYVHLPRTAVPAALADLHAALAVGAPATVVAFEGDEELGPLPGDDFPGRRFSCWEAGHLADVVVGAGFDLDGLATRRRGDLGELVVDLTRARTLPDRVGPGMAVLVVGLNPSLNAADAGMGFAGPGNRFWPAARAAGLVSRDRDPAHALAHHGVGMTDLVKRATARAAELSAREYRDGLGRLARLVAWLAPQVVCVVGLTGWRAAADRRAVPGLQPGDLGGRPVYLMPNPSGLNAGCSLAELADHLRSARALADRRG